MLSKEKCDVCGTDAVLCGSHKLRVCSQCRHVQSRFIKFPEKVMAELKRLNPDSFENDDNSEVLQGMESAKLQGQIDTLETANKDLAVQVSELEYARDNAVQEPGESKDSKLGDVAWKLAEGFANGKLENLTWADVQLVRDAA